MRENNWTPKLLPLLPEQVTWRAPFSSMGVDYMGHFFSQDYAGLRQKLYVCLFMCTTTRVIHLEVVNNLMMSLFLLCLYHLAAIHRDPLLILLDNHKMFVTSKKFFQWLQVDEEVVNYLNAHQIQWKNQTPRTLLMGGHFERLVQTDKVCLSMAVSHKLFVWGEFMTVIN